MLINNKNYRIMMYESIFQLLQGMIEVWSNKQYIYK